MDDSESKLLARCRQGEAGAWDELFDRHYVPASRFIWQLYSTFTPEDVEEITQETFLTVIRSLDTFKGGSQFQTWIFRVAANKAHDFQDRFRAQKRGGGDVALSLQSEDPNTGLLIDPPSHSPTPEQNLIASETGEVLTYALHQLGSACREILQLRYFGDFSYEEIALALELNPKTVSSRLSKCLDKLEEVARPLFAEGKPTRSSV